MRSSKNATDLIKQFEGFSPRMYLDPVGLPTIGYGTLIDTDEEKYLMTATIDEAKATVLLRGELYHVESDINKMLQKQVNQNQFDALVSFCYNLGTGALRRSTLLRKININPNDPTIRQEFQKWVYAGGTVLRGLVRRRNAEAMLYFETTIDMT